MKGQISFESLLILLVILTSTIIISSLFLQTNTNTNAYTLIRNEFLLQTNSQEKEIILEKIYFEQNSQPTFYLILKTNMSETEITSIIDLTKIEEKVNSLTILKEVNIQIKLDDN